MSKLVFVIYIFICIHVNSYNAEQTTYNCFKESFCRRIGLSDGQACSIDGTSLVACSNWQDKLIPCKSNLCVQHSESKADCLCPLNCSDRGTCNTNYQTCDCFKGYSGSACELEDFCVNRLDGIYCNENHLIYCQNGLTVANRECPYKCSNGTDLFAAKCECPNNCSGIADACTNGKCICPPNRMGLDCSAANPCFGATGPVCAGGKTLICSDNEIVKLVDCPNGCDAVTGECKCLNDCSNNGRCSFDPVSGNATCACYEEFYGDDCSLNNLCATSTHSTFCANNETLTHCGPSGEAPKTISCKFNCATIGTYMAKCRCHCYSWHYPHSLSCAEDGSCVCKEGWTGPECWTNVIPKRRAPGFCTGLVDGNFCAEDNQTLIMCRMGVQYSGIKCTRSCMSTPLGIGASCECMIGDNGLPCSGHGACLDTGTCVCNKGYFGADCSRVDKCSDVPPNFNPVRTYHLCDGNEIAVCNNKRMYAVDYCPYGCMKGSQFGFDKCNCNCGNNSIGCAAPFGECTCASGYSACPPGLSGPDCSIATTPCAGKQGRVCHAGSLLRCEQGLNMSSVACPRGCVEGDEKCSCLNGCSGHGTCSLLGQCVCNNGWGGEDCSVLLDQCAVRKSGEKYCTNHTRSDSHVEGLLTTCFKQKTILEEICAHACASQVECYCPRNCSNRGRCASGACVCAKGWFGVDCSRSSFSTIVHVVPVVIGLALVVLGLHVYDAMKYKVRLVSLADEHENLMDFATLGHTDSDLLEPTVVE